MKHLSLVTFLVAATAATAPDAEAQCRRWKNFVDPCWGIVAQGVCGNAQQQGWSDGQKHNYKKWQYGATATLVCEKWVKKYNAKNGTNLTNATVTNIVTLPGPDNLQRGNCRADGDGEGPLDASIGLVEEEMVTVDSCCSRAPNGPYAFIDPGTGSAGNDFTNTQKTTIARSPLRCGSRRTRDSALRASV